MFRFVFLSACLFSLALPVSASEDRTLQKVQASRLLFDEGVATRDALLIIAAAKLRRGSGLMPTDRMSESGSSDGNHFSWMDMLDQAREFAAGDELMLGLIEDVAAETSKGVTDGPVYNIASLAANGSDTYRNVPFDGKKYAEVYVEAKGNHDLNVHVFDSRDRLVCSDTDASAIAYCGWRPKQSGSFSVKVTNKGGAKAQYSLMTN